MNDSEPAGEPGRPWQFSVRSMMLTTASCALMFAAFRALGLPPQAALFISGLLLASFLAASALLWVITRAKDSDA